MAPKINIHYVSILLFADNWFATSNAFVMVGLISRFNVGARMVGAASIFILVSWEFWRVRTLHISNWLIYLSLTHQRHYIVHRMDTTRMDASVAQIT